MRIIIFFKYYIFAIFKRMCRYLNIYFYYENKYGLKSISKPANANRDFSKYKRIKVDPINLRMGVDGLTDEYSYCGKQIVESPHYNLIVCCENGKIEKSDYMIREQKGCLDSRNFIFRTYKTHMTHFNNAKTNMLANNTIPIIVYSINNKMYIYDGKHRAALYAYHKKTIDAIEIPAELIKSSYLCKLNELKQKFPDKYRMHSEILDYFFEFIKT